MNKNSTVMPKIIQVVGYKNTGKTTMTSALIAGLAAKGLKVAAIKHDGHDHFEMDQEGTDSYQFGKAGASAVVVVSQKRTAILKQYTTEPEDILSQLSDYDWIVIEGYKEAKYPKLVMVRETHDLTLANELQHVVGIVFGSQELLDAVNVGPEGKNSLTTYDKAKFLFNEWETIVEAVLRINSTNS